MTHAEMLTSALRHAPELASLVDLHRSGAATWEDYASAFPAGRPRCDGARGWARSVIGHIVALAVDGREPTHYADECHARMLAAEVTP